MNSYSVNKNDDPTAIAGEVEILFTARNNGQSMFFARVRLSSGDNPLKCLLLAFDKNGIRPLRKTGHHPAVLFADEQGNHYIWGLMQSSD